MSKYAHDPCVAGKLFFLILVVSCFINSCKNISTPETAGGWLKYNGNPVLSGKDGAIFDVCVLKSKKGIYKMYSSLRSAKGIALSESNDGLKWSEPVICLSYNDGSGWEKEVNRPVVILKADTFRMWYTGQTAGHSWIGYAESIDGKEWKRINNKPVLSPDAAWEKDAIMCPHVIWDEQENIFKMWYSGGEQYEPDAIGYALSKDGINWKKFSSNPVFTCDKKNKWEQAKVTACQVIKRRTDYLMLYVGFMNVHDAQIGMARSKDGISGWERYTENPIIKPGISWDLDAVYKPYALLDNNCWLLYYNGRRNYDEQIGIAIHEGIDLGF